MRQQFGYLSPTVSASVSRAVRDGMSGRGLSVVDVGRSLNMSPWTLKARLAGRTVWSAAEVDRLTALGLAEPPRRPQWLRTAEVAEMFGVTRRTVARWAVDGTLAAARTPGGHARFRREDVEDLMESRGFSPDGQTVQT